MKKLILGALLLGFSSLSFAQETNPTNNMKMTKEHKMHMRGEIAEKRIAKMQNELNLTADQMTQLKALHEKHKAERESKMAQNKAEMMQKKQQKEDEMKKILTPEQYTKWQIKRQEKANKIKGMMKDRRGKMMETELVK